MNDSSFIYNFYGLGRLRSLTYASMEINASLRMVLQSFGK